ncbi:MAG: hypothetical protein KFW07_00805, partial [Mycoplasmataceae bacterium]|nr:hypothetical protein [Mycoplasmataceae bacterium]
MKKTLLTLGSISTLGILPIALFVSCGTENKPVDLKITIPTNRAVTQKNIDDAVEVLMTESSTPKLKLEALQSIFEGITSDNIVNFEYLPKRKEESVEASIRLTSKSNFIFGSENMLFSKVVVIDAGMSVDLKITAIPTSQSVIDAAITVLLISDMTEIGKVEYLNTVFNGVTADNFKNFTYEAIATNGAVAGKVTLTAKEGFTFGSSNTLVSEVISSKPTVDLKITTIPTSQNNINTEIYILSNLTLSDAFKISSLSELFNGVTADNFKNFTYEAIATNGAVAGKITLTAKEGFTFGSSNTLVSEVIEI